MAPNMITVADVEAMVVRLLAHTKCLERLASGSGGIDPGSAALEGPRSARRYLAPDRDRRLRAAA